MKISLESNRRALAKVVRPGTDLIYQSVFSEWVFFERARKKKNFFLKSFRRGFSAFRFIPGTDDNLIIALKTAENPETKKMKTYVTVFTVDGQIYLDDQHVEEDKYEGIDFL